MYGDVVSELSASSLVAALLAAPAGVALLAQLEAAQRGTVVGFEPPADSDPAAVALAAERAPAMSFGELLSCAVSAAGFLAGPWMPGAPESLSRAYLLGPSRRPIAEAVVARFGPELFGRVRLDGQQWWYSSGHEEFLRSRPAFADFGDVYGNGEFPWNGLWTVTDPPSAVHDDLFAAWEFGPGPASRWRLPVRPGARVWEIATPLDWVRLVESYPKPAPGPHYGWELPGPNQHVPQIDELLGVPDQHAARVSRTAHLLPDWAAVARDYDGVHLSWAGFLTTEGFVSDLPDGGVTMLRYWSSERTLWLADAFGDPVPLPQPVLSGIGENHGADASRDLRRRDRDLAVLRARLGRQK